MHKRKFKAESSQQRELDSLRETISTLRHELEENEISKTDEIQRAASSKREIKQLKESMSTLRHNLDRLEIRNAESIQKIHQE